MVDIMTEFYLSFGASLWSPDGGAGPFARLGEHAYPAGGYFSMKKSNQKSLGEDPETPYPLSCGWIRSQGACGAFYLDIAETELKINLISVV